MRAQQLAAALQAELDRRAAARYEAKPEWAQLQTADRLVAKRKQLLDKKIALYEAEKAASAEQDRKTAAAAENQVQARQAYEVAVAAAQERRLELAALAASEAAPPTVVDRLDALLGVLPVAARERFADLRAVLAATIDVPMSEDPDTPRSETAGPAGPEPSGPGAAPPVAPTAISQPVSVSSQSVDPMASTPTDMPPPSSVLVPAPRRPLPGATDALAPRRPVKATSGAWGRSSSKAPSAKGTNA